MTDFTRRFDVVIDAPVHDVFEYCRDPRHLFAGWPQLEVTEVVITPDGVGTTARITGTWTCPHTTPSAPRRRAAVVASRSKSPRAASAPLALPRT